MGLTMAMHLLDRVENALMVLSEAIFARWPRSCPGSERLKHCRIVAHRGEHDNRLRFENTLAAFDAAVAAGVWGIEFDIRWTKDLQPVVIHDPGLQRVFGIPLTVAGVTRDELRQRCPHVPFLAEVIRRYGGKAHLMVEVKQEHTPDPARQNRVLGELFSGLTPGQDFHLISLAPHLFRPLAFAPKSALVPIARLNPGTFGRLAAREGYGGLAGHYAVVGRSDIEQQHAAGRKVGTGYVRAPNCLFRELNRGVDWIFSNHAAEVQALLRRLQSAESRAACSRPLRSSTK
jgi:glycerophosphoryl diester phosphodiesterase